MKTRSEAKKKETKLKYNGLFCEDCLEPQFDAPDGAGITCKNGHGGVDGISKEKKADLLLAKERESSADLGELVDKETSPFKFESANASKTPLIRPDFKKITETVFVNDLHEQWQKLKKDLTIGEKRSEHGVLHAALDRAERNSYNAHRLFITAKIEFDRWDKDNQIIISAMWSEATRSLQREKEEGLRSKQITDADVQARCATLHPEEWKAQEIERAKYKVTVDSLANLAEQWSSRCRSLQAMMSKLR